MQHLVQVRFNPDPNLEPYPKIDPHVYTEIQIASPSLEESQNNKTNPAQEITHKPNPHKLHLLP